MKLKNVRKRIKDNIIINKIYAIYFYFTLGKGQIAKFTDLIPEASGVIIIITLVFGIDLTKYKSLLGTLVVLIFISLIIMGWIFKNAGLWEVELEVNAKKNHITW